MKDCLDGKLLPISSTDGMTTMEVAEEGEVLKALVDFLYTGSLPREKLQKHVVGLFAAGDNYEIEYLREVCLHHMPASFQSSNARDFQSSNAIDFLRIGYNYQLDELRDAALNFIVKNVEELVFSDKYEESASEFPHLSVLITRGCFMGANRRVTQMQIKRACFMDARRILRHWDRNGQYSQQDFITKLVPIQNLKRNAKRREC